MEPARPQAGAVSQAQAGPKPDDAGGVAARAILHARARSSANLALSRCGNVSHALANVTRLTHHCVRVQVEPSISSSACSTMGSGGVCCFHCLLVHRVHQAVTRIWRTGGMAVSWSHKATERSGLPGQRRCWGCPPSRPGYCSAVWRGLEAAAAGSSLLLPTSIGPGPASRARCVTGKCVTGKWRLPANSEIRLHRLQRQPAARCSSPCDGAVTERKGCQGRGGDSPDGRGEDLLGRSYAFACRGARRDQDDDTHEPLLLRHTLTTRAMIMEEVPSDSEMQYWRE